MHEIILGLPGPWADDNFEAADHYTTKIGGIPDWPNLKSVIEPDLLICDTCGDNLSLIAQIYAPISTKNMTIDDRVIYIFGCISPNCSTMTWRALRVQRSFYSEDSKSLNHGPSSLSSKNELQDDLWTFDSDEEKDDKFDLDDLAKALTEATSLASQTKKQNVCLNHEDNGVKCSPISLSSRVVDDKTPVLPCFYIYTQEEKHVKDVVASACSGLTSLSEKENQNDGKEIWEGESYEYDSSLNSKRPYLNRTYFRFKKRLDMHPQQCFRYSYGGRPLLANAEGEIERCKLCGELRHYEMQLMSPLLYFLQEATDKYSLEKWNWMTLIVYTCSKACSSSSTEESDGWIIAKEAIVVQTE